MKLFTSHCNSLDVVSVCYVRLRFMQYGKAALDF